MNSTFDIQSLNAQAIKVDSYELGWRGDWDQWQADVTVYENTSDVTQFYDANERVLRLINQKERVRGIENSLTYRATDHWSVGGTYAWAKGETQQNGKWIDLPATRISPAKTTLFVGYTEDDYSLRLQGMHWPVTTPPPRTTTGATSKAIRWWTCSAPWTCRSVAWKAGCTT